MQSQIEKYRTRAGEFARLAAIAKYGGTHDPAARSPTCIGALALGDEPELRDQWLRLEASREP